MVLGGSGVMRTVAIDASSHVFRRDETPALTALLRQRT